MKKRHADRLEGLRGSEQGFTLMELLVAMVIISILVATASQMYLRHRRKAWEAQVRASVRHMAGAENYFVFSEGAPSFTNDLDDLYAVGYRWKDDSLRPYVALATDQSFCIQVHSAHDPSIVWHFSSEVGRAEPGPATPQDCGDPEALGSYIAGLPPPSAGRDGRLSVVGEGTGLMVAGMQTSSPDGGSSVEEGESGSGGRSGSANEPGPATGSGSGTNGSTIEGSTPGYGTTETTSGTVPSESAAGCTGGGNGSGATSGPNHPSGRDRDLESGGSGDQGKSGSDPDGDENDGADKPGEGGGADTGDQDGNNGSGNDSDFEDDNRGPDYDGTPVPGTNC